MSSVDFRDAVRVILYDSDGSPFATVSGSDGRTKQIVSLESGAGVLVSGTVNANNPSYYPKYEFWTAINFDDSNYVDAFVSSGTEPTLVSAMWQLNTDKAHTRILVDGNPILDVDLKELKNKFKFKLEKEESSGFPLFDVFEYEDNRWLFKPSFPVTALNEIKIQFKSKSGTKKVERGITVMRMVTNV